MVVFQICLVLELPRSQVGATVAVVDLGYAGGPRRMLAEYWHGNETTATRGHVVFRSENTE